MHIKNETLLMTGNSVYLKHTVVNDYGCSLPSMLGHVVLCQERVGRLGGVGKPVHRGVVFIC